MLPNIAPLPWPTCSGPVGLAETNSKWIFFGLLTLKYEIKSFCSYLGIYFQVKTKYNLSFNNNNPELFSRCGLNIK